MDVGEENEETEALVSVVFGLTVRVRFRQRGPRAPWRVCACVSVRAQFRVRSSTRVPFPKPPLRITSSESLSRPRQPGRACSGPLRGLQAAPGKWFCKALPWKRDVIEAKMASAEPRTWQGSPVIVTAAPISQMRNRGREGTVDRRSGRTLRPRPPGHSLFFLNRRCVPG